MVGKRIRTIRFSPTSSRHMVGKKGLTICRIAIRSQPHSTIEQSRPADVECWLCRKQGGLLRPLNGICLTGSVRGGKTHIIYPHLHDNWRSPCKLFFESGEIQVNQPYRRVTCGHCMRHAFE